MARATINDVANSAGVSKKTVSRVLNQEANVHLDTRQRVLDAMEQLNYRPSKQARGLATTRSYLIGLIYDNPNKSYISEIQEGCLESCTKMGYHLLIQPLNYQSGKCLDDIRYLVIDSQMDGLILTPPFSDDERILALLEELKRPFTRIGGTYHDTRAPHVTANDKKISFQMTDYLVHLGHKRIAFIKGHRDHSASELRYCGYLNALEEHGLSVQEQYVEEGGFEFQQAEKAARKLLSLKERPTAIFASNDQMAAAVLKVAEQNDIEIPHQLSVCGFDDAPISRYIWPSITTVRQPLRDIATCASLELIQGIKKNSGSLPDHTFDCELKIRASTAPPGRR